MHMGVSNADRCSIAHEEATLSHHWSAQRSFSTSAGSEIRLSAPFPNTLLDITFFSKRFLNDPFIYSYLAFPYFFVALGQWLLLRRFVRESGWWLLTGVPGFFFFYPYVLIYGYQNEVTGGQSLIFGTPDFWRVSLWLALISCVFGGIVGLVQGLSVIKRYGVRPLRVLWWVITTAVAWGVGYPIGEQFVQSIFSSHEPAPFSWTLACLVEGATWGTIGIITGATFIWLGRAKVNDQ